MDQGWAQFLTGNSAEARRSLDDAARLAAAAKADTLLAWVNFSLAQVLARDGDAAGAEASFREGIRLAAARGDRAQQNYGFGVRGFTLMNASQFEEAIYWFERELPWLEQRGDRTTQASALVNIGWCYYRLGALERAQGAFEKAEALSRESGNAAVQQRALGNLGNVALDRRDFAAAAAANRRALALSEKTNAKYDSARWLGNLARISIETGDWNAAEQYNQRALALKRELNDQPAELYSIVYAARIAQGRGQSANAEHLFRQVTDSITEDPVPVLDARDGLAHLFSDAGRPRDAEAQYRTALDLVEKTRVQLLKPDSRLSYQAAWITLNQHYVEFLMAQGQTERALEAAEASRARLLAERLGLKAGGTARAADYRQLAKRTGALLLSYWLAPERSWVWTVGGDRITAYPLPSENNIRHLVETYRAVLEKSADPAVTGSTVGRELWNAVAAPVAAIAGKASHVIVVPDGPLYMLNFETLVSPQPAPHYWIEDVELAVAPSLNILVSGGAAPAVPGASLLLIGDPESPAEEYPKLPYAAQEVAAVERNFTQVKPQVLQGAEATPDAFLAMPLDRFRYIHFAAHATANREEPLDSAVILSRQGNHYKLAGREVLERRLRADLVTISACESAGAHIYSGEGLVGLAWAFMQAGARNVIAGLWDVSDASTPRLMGDFYARLSKGDRPAEALRDAKLGLLHGGGAYHIPYYWAPLELFVR